ncbi:A/G-specific adenine glycosylase [Bacteroidota bacterium]
MKISEIILNWYKKNKRNLPWRYTNDPFKIWVSEIILQQTRVDQGLGYYLRFIDRFPDLTSLAEADEQEVIKLWQGLGYYSRARNLHYASRQIINTLDGIFPSTYISLMKLKGVGPYTAAAIASFSFNEAVAVVDGNVSRVLSRLFALTEPINSTQGQKMLEILANELLDKDNPGEYNQGIMEFGAIQCVPGKPDCQNCPLKDKCEAMKIGAVQNFPIKLKKGVVKERYFTYLIINQGGFTYLHKRTGNDIWKQMFEFPLIEQKDHLNMEMLEKQISDYSGLNNKDFTIRSVSKPVKHQLTHRTIFAHFIHLDILKLHYEGLSEWIKISFDKISEFPLPRLIDRYMEEKGSPNV